MNYKELVFALNKIGIALSSQRNLNKLLNLIVEEIIDFADCDAASLYIREYNPDQLIFQAAKNMTMEKRNSQSMGQFKAFPVALQKKSIAGYTAITGEIINIPDCYNLPVECEYQFNKSYDEMNSYRTVSMLSVPMKTADGNILGVIQLINKFDKNQQIIPFSQEFEEIITSLASQAAVAITNVRLLQQNKDLYKALVSSFSEAIEARSPHTAGHSKRVAYICLLIANEISKLQSGRYAGHKFTRDEIEELRIAALLHDIGKIAVPEVVLEKVNKLTPEQVEVILLRFECIKYYLQNSSASKEEIQQAEDDLKFILLKNIPGFMSDADLKRLSAIADKNYLDFHGESKKWLSEKEHYFLKVVKGNFTPEEYKIMQNHVVHTYDILQNIPFTEELENIPSFAGSHHEMLNGTGYPKQIQAEDIPLQARIMAVADIFEALTAADRPYKPAIPLEKSLDILRMEVKSGRLDADLVDLFIEHKLYDQYIEAHNENRDVV